jgi:two-component system, OmpR family, sensor histidine kinase MprB
MTLKTRFASAIAATVGAAVALASVTIFFVLRAQLRSEVDEALRNFARDISLQQSPGGLVPALPTPTLGGARPYAQAIDSGDAVLTPRGVAPAFEPSPRARAVAAGREPAFFDDMDIGGIHVRVYTARVNDLFAVQVVRSLNEVDKVLERLALFLVIVAVCGVALAATLGRFVAAAVLKPVRRLTQATEHVTTTSDLDARIDSSGRDELGRLASSFNSMLEAVKTSVDSQRQLVADASHELRTPLTSIRTNIEVLAGTELEPEERKGLLGDVVFELEQLTALISDLVELARGRELHQVYEDLRFDEVVSEAVARARRQHGPLLSYVVDLEPTAVRGVRERLDRAVRNLLDNAAKWSPPGGTIEVTLRGGRLSVRDHGPGIDAADLPYVFDRFYRAAVARGMPGSGLGLAIVRDVAESHGGSVAADIAEGGGARLTLWLPVHGRGG